MKRFGPILIAMMELLAAAQIGCGRSRGGLGATSGSDEVRLPGKLSCQLQRLPQAGPQGSILYQVRAQLDGKAYFNFAILSGRPDQTVQPVPDYPSIVAVLPRAMPTSVVVTIAARDAAEAPTQADCGALVAASGGGGSAPPPSQSNNSGVVVPVFAPPGVAFSLGGQTKDLTVVAGARATAHWISQGAQACVLLLPDEPGPRPVDVLGLMELGPFVNPRAGAITVPVSLECAGRGGATRKTVAVKIETPPQVNFGVAYVGPPAADSPILLSLNSNIPCTISGHVAGNIRQLGGGTNWQRILVPLEAPRPLLNAAAVYRAVCQDGPRTATREVTLPAGTPPRNLTIKANGVAGNYTLATGTANVAITWSAENARECNVAGLGSGVAGTSTVAAVTITRATHYTLTCSNGFGSASSGLTVNPVPCTRETRLLLNANPHGGIAAINAKLQAAHLPQVHPHGALRLHEPTARKICELFGFNAVKRMDCRHSDGRCNYTSPGDNYHHWWNGTTLVQDGARHHQWISTLECERTCGQ